MLTERVPLQNSIGEGFVIPLGPVNLVGVVARNGMVGCGAVDVAALEKFGYPAARVRPSTGTKIEKLLTSFPDSSRRPTAVHRDSGSARG